MRLVFVGESDLDHAGDAMTSAIFSDGLPMTEADFLAIGETPERIELFDGSLLVTPNPTPRHQHISSELLIALRPVAERTGLQAHGAVNIRLQTGRISIPDVAVTEPIDYDESVVDAASVRLVCEIVSPSNAAADKVMKMHYYAAAGIRWYLLVEQKTGLLRLHELVGGHYLERSVTGPGDILHLTDPVDTTISPEDLQPPA